LLLALREAPDDERRWARGADGEEMVAATLQARCRDGVVVLHDRAIPGSRTNIDHIAIAPSGVWVVDTKRYSGKVRVAKPLFGAAKLTVAGRDRTKLVSGLVKQASLVAPVAKAVEPTVAVHGALCFVQGDLPMFGTPVIDRCLVLHRRSLAKRLNADGPLSTASIERLAASLSQAFPPA
jgi:hypothetical protein